MREPPLKRRTVQHIRHRFRLTTTLASFLLLTHWLTIYTTPGVSAQTLQRKSAKEMTTAQVLEAEQRLWTLGYWAGTADGRFDSSSRHALIAFQKVERRPRTGVLTPQELDVLRNASRPLARFGRYPHVEVDLERQVLFVVDEDGEVIRILPVSTGNGELYTDRGQVHRARTPTGGFTVLRKIRG